MEESVSRLPENCRHLVVVVGHQLWFGRLLGKREEAMDILDSLKCFLKVKDIGKNINFTLNMSDYMQYSIKFFTDKLTVNDLLLKKH